MDDGLAWFFMKVDNLNALTHIHVINGFDFMLSIGFTVAFVINLDKTAYDDGLIFGAPVLKLLAVIIEMSFGGVERWGFLDGDVGLVAVDEVEQVVHLNVPADAGVELWEGLLCEYV